jgi:hypothetical protein
MPQAPSTASARLAVLLASGSLLAVAAQALAQTDGSASAPIAVSEDRQLEKLADTLTGYFTSSLQAQQHPGRYFDIRVHAVRIWRKRTDGPWIYEEQATAKTPNAPFRQRVYRLGRQDARTMVASIFTLEASQSHVGDWRKAEPLADLTPADLQEKKGCEVYLQAKSFGFTGGTLGEGCASDQHGAIYATAEWLLNPTGVNSWDRGFNAQKQQVWGAQDGPYHFIRQQ